jgi:hypothetical protein
MNDHLSESSFCQFGGHDSTIVSTGLQLRQCHFSDNGHVSTWMVCPTCIEYLERISDPAMLVLCIWAYELSPSDRLPASVRETPLKQSLLIQHLDEILNNKIRKKLGNRFPAFLSDLKGSEKDFFIQTLQQNSTLADIFLPDVEDVAGRLSIALKIWVDGIASAKGTRRTYNVAGGEEEYSPEQRKADFKVADDYAKKDEIFRAGVQAAPILEFIIRRKKDISLQGAKRDSPIWKYIRDCADPNSVTQEDLLVCGGCILDDKP